MNPVDLAWLAGWLEGEGSFIATRQRADRPKQGTILRVQANTVDGDIVHRIQRIAGGFVSGPHGPYAGNRQPLWRWHLGRRDDVIALARQLRPLMGERRQAQVDAVLALYEATEGARA